MHIQGLIPTTTLGGGQSRCFPASQGEEIRVMKHSPGSRGLVKWGRHLLPNSLDSPLTPHPLLWPSAQLLLPREVGLSLLPVHTGLPYPMTQTQVPTVMALMSPCILEFVFWLCFRFIKLCLLEKMNFTAVLRSATREHWGVVPPRAILAPRQPCSFALLT